MKIQLVKAPTDSPLSLLDKWHMPMDQLSVAAAAIDVGADVEIIDGNMISLESILEKIDGSALIVGLSFTVEWTP